MFTLDSHTGSRDSLDARFPRTHAGLGVIVGTFKSVVTRWAHQNGYPDFAWQPRFHDRVIRGARELVDVREYIRGNVARDHAKNGDVLP